jgi:hypothetical protein
MGDPSIGSGFTMFLKRGGILLPLHGHLLCPTGYILEATVSQNNPCDNKKSKKYGMLYIFHFSFSFVGPL